MKLYEFNFVSVSIKLVSLSKQFMRKNKSFLSNFTKFEYNKNHTLKFNY